MLFSVGVDTTVARLHGTLRMALPLTVCLHPCLALQVLHAITKTPIPSGLTRDLILLTDTQGPTTTQVDYRTKARTIKKEFYY